MKNKIYVSMTDKFMSGWGCAANRINKFVVICDTLEQARIVKMNAERRSEMKYINICWNKPSYPCSRYLISWKNYSELGEIWKRN